MGKYSDSEISEQEYDEEMEEDQIVEDDEFIQDDELIQEDEFQEEEQEQEQEEKEEEDQENEQNKQEQDYKKQEKILNRLLNLDKLESLKKNENSGEQKQKVEWIKRVKEQSCALADEEKVCEQDINKLQECYRELKQLVESVHQRLHWTQQQLQHKDFNTQQGIAFLDAKTSLLFNYNLYLLIYLLAKVQGQGVQHHPVIKQLLYQKTLFQKLAPIDKKLNYQVDKLIKKFKENKQNQKIGKVRREEDPESYKPNPQNMAEYLTTENMELDEHGEIVENKTRTKYVVPKIMATMSTKDAKEKKMIRENERKNRTLLHNQFVNSLADEYNEGNNYRNNSVNGQMDKHEIERQKYEEDNYMRLPVTKRDKIKLKSKANKNNQGEKIDDFREFHNIRNVLKTQNIIKKNSEVYTEKMKIKKSLAIQNKKIQKDNKMKVRSTSNKKVNKKNKK